MAYLNFLTLNAKGLRDSAKRSSLWHWLSSLPSPPDIICLQETHSVDNAELLSWFSYTGFSVIGSHGTCHKAGTAILHRSSIVVSSSFTALSGRFVRIDVSGPTVPFTVCNVYAPNCCTHRNAFFAEVADLAQSPHPVLLAGDFNAVFNRLLDRRDHTALRSYRDSSAALTQLFSSVTCNDIWRIKHPTLRSFSWSDSGDIYASRIDLLGVPLLWEHQVSSADYTPCPYSDHSCLQANIKIPSPVTLGPGFWKLNTSLLKDPEYIKTITSFWIHWKTRKGRYSTLPIWWDIGKQRIRRLSRRYATKLKTARTSSRTTLNAQILTLRRQLDAGDHSVLNPYNDLLLQIQHLDAYETEGLRVRSRARWAEEGETSSKYFFRSIRRNQSKNTIHSMLLPDGSTSSESSELLKIWRDFYINLFSADAVDLNAQEDLFCYLETSLSSDESSTCDGPIANEPACAALKGMARGKTPGSDGLPAEFYLAFWPLLGDDLVSVLNVSFVNGCLSPSQRFSIISLIPKKGDLRLCKNWRPISLLNVDYKIASRTIAGRLLKVLHSVIGSDQTGSVPGRFIGENVLLLNSICEYATYYNLPVALVSLDQEKAFDRVDRPFLFRLLSKMGFGPSFISWIVLFYTNIKSSVSVNGFLSEEFSLSRGVRQGCPLSALLYVIFLESFSVTLRADPLVQGLLLPGSSQEAKVTQYADDTTLVLTTDSAIHAAFAVYDVFASATGARLNQSKSEGLFLGSWAGRLDPPVSLKWSSSSLHCLGVSVGPQVSSDILWDKRLRALSAVLDVWQSRHLSFHGKALILNAIGLSGLWYNCTLLTPSSAVLTKVNTAIFKFFWSNKKDLVKRSVVVLPKLRGGYGVVDVKLKVMALHAQWAKRYFVSPGKWAFFFVHWCRVFYGVPPESVFTHPDIYPLRILPPFFKSIFSSWAQLGGFCKNDSFFVNIIDSPATPVSSITTKMCYMSLVAGLTPVANCVSKFRPIYDTLYWKDTWAQIHLFPLDRYTIDTSWKVAHGVLYTADRLLRLGVNVDPACFCLLADETPAHLFFECHVAAAVLQHVMLAFKSAVPVCPPLNVQRMLFGFSPDDRLAVPPVFSYVLNLVKSLLWRARNDFVFSRCASVSSRYYCHLTPSPCILLTTV